MVLVARGMTNAEIAGWLHLGEATVKTHVTSILSKLRLKNRAQVVAAAYETGTVRLGQSAVPVG
jgi:DNA-binding NarL/FixJ family response regulator